MWGGGGMGEVQPFVQSSLVSLRVFGLRSTVGAFAVTFRVLK